MEYRIPSEEVDLEQLKKWVEQDPFHRHSLTANHWLPAFDETGQPEKGVQHLAVCDEKGVVFYLRMSNVMRVEVQFPPAGDEERVKKGLREAFSAVYVMAKKRGYKEMMFDSVSQHLIRFFSKLGFNPVKDHYKVGIL